ncbi:MAG: hypothetical protein L7W43_11285, partial [Rubripirellula sp.]|nr:hypothetical protein [Rubripirellula sp.]
MTQSRFFTRSSSLRAIAVCAALFALPAAAQLPMADADYDASGYVTPAGMAHPSMYQGGVVPAGMAFSPGMQGNGPAAFPGGVMPVGFMSGGQCDGNCGSCDPGAGSCGGISRGGLLGSRNAGHGLLGGGTCLQAFCDYWSIDPRYLGSNLQGLGSNLGPHGEICGLRWYDLSAEAVFLGHTQGGGNMPVTALGQGNPPSDVVLSLGDVNDGDELAAGVRLSGALICGVGGNIEATYMGGNKWNANAQATSAGNDLYSFISDFGDPIVLDDVDQSSSQSIATESALHSIELNYRRRTMGPRCRFQGSWLFGLRYLQFKNELNYSAFNSASRFFNSQDRVRNHMFGAQAGGDIWWNIYSGVRLGMGLKAAWVQNEIKRSFMVDANSIADTTINETRRGGDLMGEFELKFVWQLNHSWKFRSAYYVIAAEDIGFGSIDKNTILNLEAGGNVVNPAYVLDDLVVQGI